MAAKSKARRTNSSYKYNMVIVGRWGRTPLQEAVDGSHGGMVELLRRKGGVLQESLSTMQVIVRQMESEEFNIAAILVLIERQYHSVMNTYLCAAMCSRVQGRCSIASLAHRPCWAPGKILMHYVVLSKADFGISILYATYLSV